MEYGNRLNYPYKVNDNDNLNNNQNGYRTTKNFYEYEEFAVPSLVPCELCNRTFVPESLEKHKRGCVTTLRKRQERQCMSNDKNIYHINGDERGMLTIYEMSKKRRLRQVCWRSKHAEFVKAMKSGKCSVDGANNEVPIPSAKNFVRCPHCLRRYHENTFNRHVTKCERQHKIISKDSPSYKTVEVNRQLAARINLQMQPKLDTNITVPESRTSSGIGTPSWNTSKCSSSKTDASNKIEDLKKAGHNAQKKFYDKKKIHPPISNNHSRSVGKPQLKELVASNKLSEHSISTFDDRQATSNSTDICNSSTFTKQNPPAKSVNKTNKQSKLNSESRTTSSNPFGKSYISWSLKRSTSFLSCLESSLASQTDKNFQYYDGSGDTKLFEHKPLSFAKTKTIESINQLDIKKPSPTIRSMSNHGHSEISNKYPKKLKETALNMSSNRKNRSQTSDSLRRPLLCNQIESQRLQEESQYRKNEAEVLKTIEKVLNGEFSTSSTKHTYKDFPNMLMTENCSNDIKLPVSLRKSTNNVDHLIDQTQNEIVSAHVRQSNIQNSFSRQKMPGKQCCHKSVNSYEKSSNCPNPLKHQNMTNIILSKPKVSTDKDDDSTAKILHNTDLEYMFADEFSDIFLNNCNSSGVFGKISKEQKKNSGSPIAKPNSYRYKSSSSVSILNKNNTIRYRSTISLKNSLNCVDQNNRSSTIPSYFCDECGHMYPMFNAKFCCSCGCKRYGN